MAIDLSNPLFHIPALEGSGTALADISGNGRNATSAGTSPAWAAGKWGTVPSLTTANKNRLVVSHNAAFNVNEITVLCLINPSVWTTSSLTAVSCKQQNSSGFPSFDLRIDSGGSAAIQSSVTVGTTGYTALGPTAIRTGYFYYVGFTFGSNTLRTWTQGVPGAANTSMTGDLAASSADWWWGNNPIADTRGFQGTIQDIWAWPRVLNDESMAAFTWPLMAGRLINGGLVQ